MQDTAEELVKELLRRFAVKLVLHDRLGTPVKSLVYNGDYDSIPDADLRLILINWITRAQRLNL